MTDEQLKQLARETIQGVVFTSLQIPVEKRHEYIPMVFMLILLMDEPQLEKLLANQPAMFYGYMRDACPMGIDGYPCLMSLGHLNQADTTKFVGYVKKLHLAMEAL